jgi:hypothetical protein
VNGVNDSSGFFESFFHSEIVEIKFFDFGLCIILCLSGGGALEAEGSAGRIDSPQLSLALVKC